MDAAHPEDKKREAETGYKTPSAPRNRVEFQENHVLIISDKRESLDFQEPNGDFYPPTGNARAASEQVDRGFAWMVCLASCVLTISTDGFCFTLNVFFPIFQETFGEGAAKTSLIGALLTGLMLLSGPFMGYAVRRFGSRVVCFVGSFVAALGLIISAMADSVSFLILSLGVLTGLGFGGMMTASMVSLMTWFVHRRPIAMGLSTIVGGSGMFIYPFLVHYLREEYSLAGCFLICGGIILQGCVVALLLRPAPTLHPITAQQAHSRNRLTNSAACCCCHCNSACCNSACCGYFSVLRDWRYSLLIVSTFLYAMGYYPLMMFIASRAVVEAGVEPDAADYLITVIGFAQIGGRVLGMVLIGRAWVNTFLLTACLQVVVGVAIGLSIFCTDYATQVAFCLIYGIIGGYGFIALGILMGELVSVNDMAMASGFFTFAVGLSAMSGGPFAGGILDDTEGSFTTVFLVMGAITTCGALLLLPIWYSQHRDATRKYIDRA